MLDREEHDRSAPLGRALDIGCGRGQFTPELGRRGWDAVGLDASQRRAAGGVVSALANPGATILMLAFGPSRFRSLVGGVSRADVEAAFPGWELSAVDPADTSGLGWPMNRTMPQWYRLRR